MVSSIWKPEMVMYLSNTAGQNSGHYRRVTDPGEQVFTPPRCGPTGHEPLISFRASLCHALNNGLRMFYSLISQQLLTSYNQGDLKVNLLERILRNLSLSLVKLIDMIRLLLSSCWENGCYVWSYSSHLVTMRHQNTEDSGAAEEKESTSCQISQGILLRNYRKPSCCCLFKAVFTYFQRKEEGGRETLMCISCSSHVPY